MTPTEHKQVLQRAIRHAIQKQNWTEVRRLQREYRQRCDDELRIGIRPDLEQEQAA